jgi:hypothetical protein
LRPWYPPGEPTRSPRAYLHSATAISQAQWTPPPRQFKPSPSSHAEFVICDYAIEEYHRSLKQNASLEKSPTRTVKTQSNHFFVALCTFVKLEWLRTQTKLNHYALKAKLYLSALLSAFQSLQALQPLRLAQPCSTA